MLDAYTFDKEQQTIERAKENLDKRVSDEYISEIVANIRGELTPQDKAKGQVPLRPLVALEATEGQEIERRDLLLMLKTCPFPNKRTVVREVKAGRAKGFIRNGSLTLIHNSNQENADNTH